MPTRAFRPISQEPGTVAACTVGVFGRNLLLMAVRPNRPLCRVVALAFLSAGCGGCFTGHSVAASTTSSSLRAAASPSSTSAPPPSVAPATSVASTTTSAAPTTTTTTTTSIAPGPPFPVAGVSLPFVDPSRPTVSHGHTVSANRALTTTVWFPNRPGRFPLVVFAHGFQVSPAPYASLLETWAAHGFVVAAPAFPLTDPDVAGANLDEADIDNQPADVRFVTDQLVSQNSPVSGRIDPSRIAVAGHSDGAETALAAGTSPAPSGEPPYRAVLVLSGQPVPGAAGRNPPALVIQGDADTINPPDYGYSTWDQAASPKYLLVLRGAGHLPPFESGSAWLAGVESVTDAFLDAYAAGDAPVQAIAADAARYANMSLRAG